MAFRYSPKIVTDGLVLCLDAANTKSFVSGSTVWNDLTKNNYSGSLINGPIYSALNNGVLVFDGVDDYILNTINKTNIGSLLTISLWVYPTNAQSGRGILQFASSLNNILPFLLLQRASSSTISWYINGGYRITETVLDNKYTNITLTYNGTRWSSYINGSLSLSNYIGPIGTNNGDSFYIGNGFNGYFSGRIPYVNIYNRNLSESEVLQNYNATKSRFGL